MNSFPIIKLEQGGPLSEVERDAVIAIGQSESTVRAGQNVVSEGEAPTSAAVILDGWAARYKILDDGRRQIISLHVAGDWVDLHSFFVECLDHSIAAITDCRIARVDHADLRRLIADHPRLGLLLWRETIVEASAFREWVVNIGARDAERRLAHLLCEMRARMGAVGLLRDGEFVLPLTQAELADATGISAVHLNRVVKSLRERGLLDPGQRTVSVGDWPGLARFGGFDPQYLHLTRGMAAGATRPLTLPAARLSNDVGRSSTFAGRTITA